MLFVFLIGLADVYVAGKFGKEIQAAYGVVFQLYFIFSIVATALTVGVVSVVAMLFTAAKKENLSFAVGSALAAASVGGIFFSIGGFILSGPILSFFRVPTEVIRFAIPLAKIYFLGLFCNYVLLTTNGILRACDQILKSLLTMFLVCILNVVLNFFLAFKTPLGFYGIAVATVASSFCGSIMNFSYCRSLLIRGCLFSWDTLWKILSIGWPAGLMQVLWQSGVMVLFLILACLPQNAVETMAAFTNGIRIEGIIFLPAFAFNMANAVVVGNLLGKSDYKNAFLSGIITAVSGVAIVVILTVIVLFQARAISLFLSDNPIVIQECVRYIFISLLFEPIMAWGVILGGGLSGAGDTKSVMISILVSIWFIRIPLSYLFGIMLGYGASGIWWAMNISLFIQAVLISFFYFRNDWKNSSSLVLSDGKQPVVE